MRVDRLFSSTSLGGQGPGVYDTQASATGLPEAARRLRQKGDARFRAMAAGTDRVAGARAEAAKADHAFNNSILGAIGVGGDFIEAGRDMARALRENEAAARRKIDVVEAENGFDANVVEIPSLMGAVGVSGEPEHVAALQQAHAHALGQIRDENDRALLAPRLDRKLALAIGEASKVSHQRTMRDARTIIDQAINARGAQAATPGEVSEHLNTVQEIYGLIDDGRAAGVFGAGEAERRKAAARTTYGIQFARAAMTRDPEAFLAGLDAGHFTALLGKDDGALTRWRDEGARVLDQRESAAKLEDLSAYAANYGEVRAQVDSGVLSVAALKEMDWLRRSDIDWLTQRVEEKDTEARRQQELLADMDGMRDGKAPADSDRRRQAEEALFALGIKGDLENPTDATPQVIADTARRYDGRVPDFVTDQIVETFAGGVPEYQVLAAKAMIELGIVGEGVTARVALPDAARAYVMANAAKAGMSPADAVAQAAQALAPDAATRAARQEGLEAGDYDKTNERWLAQQGIGDGLIARRNAARQGRLGAEAPLEVAALQDGFRKYFARVFAMTGDAGAARPLAANLAADEALEALSDGGTVVGGAEAAVLQGNLGDPSAPISTDDLFEAIGGQDGVRGYFADLISDQEPALREIVARAQDAEEIQVAILPLIGGAAVAFGRIVVAALARRGIKEAAKQSARDIGEGAAQTIAQEAAKRLIDARNRGEELSPTDALVEATRKEFEVFLEGVKNDPLNLENGPTEFAMDLSGVDEELKQIIVDRGEAALGEKGELEVRTKKGGALKFLIKHGELGTKDPDYRLTIEDLLAFVDMAYKREPKHTIEEDRNVWRWIRQRDNGKFVLYVAKEFLPSDPRNHAVTVHVMENPPAGTSQSPLRSPVR